MVSQGMSDELINQGFVDVKQLLSAGCIQEDIVRAGISLHDVVSAGILPSSLNISTLWD